MRTMLTKANILWIIISNIPQTVYMKFTAFETFRNCCLFWTFGLLRNFYSGDAHHANYDKHSLNHHFRYSAHCIWDLQCFQTFWNCSLFCTFRLLRNSYSGDAHHEKYAKHSIHHHLQHCAHCVYQISTFWSFSKLVFVFLHLGFYEISTPMMRPMQTMVNVVQIIFSDIVQTG